MSSKIWKALWIVGAFALLIGLPVTWRWTPLSDWISIENATGWFAGIRSSNYVVLWVALVYVIAAMVFLPINLLIFVTALFFDNIRASLLVALGVGVNTATGYAIGRLGGSGAIKKMGSERLQSLMSKLAEADFVDLFLFRLIPVTPFSTVNAICGLLKIPLLRFFAATFAAIAPGAALIILFEGALTAFIRNLSWQTGALLAVALAALVVGAFLLRRRVASRS